MVIFYMIDIASKGLRLCLPKTSFHEQVILELHAGETTGHFGRDKTITMVENHFY